MKKHYKKIVESNDSRVATYFGNINNDINSDNYHLIVNPVDGMANPGGQIGTLVGFVPAYFCEDSKYYKNEKVLDVCFDMLDVTRKLQREDGTFDLLISNFYSAPDTGFIMHNITRAYKIIDKYAVSERELELKKELFLLIQKAAKGLCYGGFHTPNHRWVEAGGLAMAYNITKEEYLKDMAMKYLQEGMDIDENGEWTEKSPAIYNAVSDNAVMILAEELNIDELYDPVEMNMNLMFHYIEPDGSVFTQNSVRVDKNEGNPSVSFYPVRYYDIYLRMAYLKKNKKYAKFADLIYQAALNSGKLVQPILWLYMIEEGLKDFEIELEDIESEYESFYKPSKIVRKRKDDLSITVLGDNPNFLFVQKGKMRCFVRMCSSFFAVAQFKGENITKTAKGYQMKCEAHGKYRLPFDEKPETSVFGEMDHSKRKTTNHVSLEYVVDIEMIDGGVKLKIKTNGCDRVPIKLEFCLSGNCTILGDEFMKNGTPGDSLILGEKSIKASIGKDAITIGPGFMKHNYAQNMRGSLAKSNNDFTVYCTEYTNINKEITISTK